MANHTPAALRAARRILPFIGSEHAIFLNDLAGVIEHETGLPELIAAAQKAGEAIVGHHTDRNWKVRIGEICPICGGTVLIDLHAALKKAKGEA